MNGGEKKRRRKIIEIKIFKSILINKLVFILKKKQKKLLLL